MNIQEISKEIHNKTGLSVKDSHSAVSALVEIVKSELAAGNEVRISGLGSLSKKATKARKGRNPSTGAEIDIPASHRVSFRSAKALSEAVK